MKVIVDRIEGSVAVVEVDGRMWDVPLSWLPAGTREGTALTPAFTVAEVPPTPALRIGVARKIQL